MTRGKPRGKGPLPLPHAHPHPHPHLLTPSSSSSIIITIIIISHHRPPTSWTNFRRGAAHFQAMCPLQSGSPLAQGTKLDSHFQAMCPLQSGSPLAQGTKFDYPAPKVLSKICFTLMETVATESCRSIQGYTLVRCLRKKHPSEEKGLFS